MIRRNPMGMKHVLGMVVCLGVAGVAGAEVNTPRMPDYALPHEPTPPGERLSREGIVWVEGALLSSPCVSGTVMQKQSGEQALLQTRKQSVVVLMEGCGDGAQGGGAGVPVTVDVASGAPFRESPPRRYRLSHGSSALPLNVWSEAQVLRVEMRYE
ncbi:hypothetical protein FOT43_22565 [Serratia marcescens]|uniref:hypothetical protein n=1 Tax=Serratia marcescens TaxID=615 RepID=UPI00117F35AC|nr:hypothetical protein [Serratia marcescens]TSB25743.1 hypothetical protein FOT43_22565 [Serratia marcescens]TXE43916.1 hypothetical protein FOT60_12555 [Serratia marcescens]